ncbi:unnamed protein product, partial [Closterium sp. NIES-53]
SRAENANFIKCEITTSLAQMPAYWNMGVGTWLRTYVYDRVTPRSGKPTMWTLVFTQVVSALWHVSRLRALACESSPHPGM